MKLLYFLAPLFLWTTCQADNEQHILSNTKAKSDLGVKAIVNLHNKANLATAHEKQFKGKSLAYITPWNSRGYDVVKEFKGKFD